MSKILTHLPADHQACFFLCGAFLQCLPSNVRAHLDGVRLEFQPASPCTMSLLPQTSVLFFLFELHLPPVLAHSIFLHLVPATAVLSLLLWPHAVLTHLPPVGITRAGGSIFPTCQFHEFFSGLSSHQFLVDSEASLSVFPAPASSSASRVKLLTADGSSVLCSGSRIIPLLFGSCSFNWMFQLAPLSVLILRADFLRHLNLLLEGFQWLLSGFSCHFIILLPANVLLSMCSPLLHSEECLQPAPSVSWRPLLWWFHRLSTTIFSLTLAHQFLPKPTTWTLTSWLSPKLKKAGFIHRSTTLWASPLHKVKKKDGGWRPCGDYQGLNTFTVPDLFPLPNIADFTLRINGSTVFSKTGPSERLLSGACFSGGHP